MEETITLINNIIKEHRIITRKVRTLEQAANDAETLRELKKAREVFIPGRFSQASNLQKLQELITTISLGFEAHFNLEETGLLIAFEKHGDKELASTLRSLLSEHEDLRGRFVHLKKNVAELVGGELSHYVWEANAYDMRAYVSHTRKLIEEHALTEQRLLQKLRSQLMRREKKNG